MKGRPTVIFPQTFFPMNFVEEKATSSARRQRYWENANFFDGLVFRGKLSAFTISSIFQAANQLLQRWRNREGQGGWGRPINPTSPRGANHAHCISSDQIFKPSAIPAAAVTVSPIRMYM